MKSSGHNIAEPAVGWEDDPRWLQLPPAKRKAAADRMGGIQEYLSLPKATAADADRLADRLGLKRTRFFELVRIWKRTRHPVDLVPYKEPVVVKAPMMDSQRREIAKAAVARALAGVGDRTPREVIRRVREQWPAEHGRFPGRDTVLRIVRGLDDGAQPTFRREGGDVAHSFGDVIVVDHTVPDIFVESVGGPSRSFLTLAMDLMTGTAAGAWLALEPPGPAAVEAALRDAERRSASLDAGSTRPRISLAAEFGAEWTALLGRLAAAGLSATSRRMKSLNYGSAVRRVMGDRLGRVRLIAREGPARSAAFDPVTHVALSLDEARKLIDHGIAQQAATIQNPRRLDIGF